MKRLIIASLFLFWALPASAAGFFSIFQANGPVTTTTPVVQSLTCNAALPVANGTNVTLLAGGSCTYSATCGGVACSGGSAITGWAISGQSTANAYSITSGGVLQGGSAAASVTAGSYTVTVEATNANGTSPGVTQSVVVANTIPTVASNTCTINLPVSNGSNVSPTCTYTATCDGQACVSPYAITGWAITSQSVTNGFSITSGGVLQGGSGAASVVAGSPTVTVTATNAVGTSSGVTQTVNVNATGSCPKGSSFADGCPGAPVATIQFPTALSGGGYSGQSWATQPPWNVAGVDYPVGIPSAVTLIDWQTIVGAGGTGPNTLTTNGATASGNVLHFASTSGVLIGMPVTGTNIPGSTLITAYTSTTITISNNVTSTGVANGATITINSGGSAIGISSFNFSVNSNNVVVDSIDFSLHNSAQVIVHGSGVTIQNSNFFFGSNCTTSCNQLINFVGGASNGTLLNNILDGNGAIQTASSDQSTLVAFSGGGSMTMKYNYFRNFVAHVIEYNTGTNIDYHYNLVYNPTCNSCGAHANWLQWGTGDQGTASVTFNFGYAPVDAGVGGQGWQFTPNGAVGAITFTLANNVAIYTPTGVGIVDAFNSVGGVSTTGLIYGNYIDSRGNGYFFSDANACPLGSSSNKYGAACSSGNASNIDPTTNATITTTP